MRRDGFWFDRVRRFDPTTWDINNGECEDWANRVALRVKATEVVWLDEFDEEVSHCAALIDGRWYDAECLDGVDDWQDLPLVRNKGRTREEVLAERKWLGLPL